MIDQKISIINLINQILAYKRIQHSAAKLVDDAVVYKQIRGIEDYNKTTQCTYFLIVLFIKGSRTHFIDNTEFPIGNNQLHFLFPGQNHLWITDSETFAHKIVVGQKLFESFSNIDEFTFFKK